MPSEFYQVQQLMGYTDGKPSWGKVFGFPAWDYAREGAEQIAHQLTSLHPDRKYRVRKIKRK